jgi:hypothetical protein
MHNANFVDEYDENWPYAYIYIVLSIMVNIVL